VIIFGRGDFSERRILVQFRDSAHLSQLNGAFNELKAEGTQVGFPSNWKSWIRAAAKFEANLHFFMRQTSF
jgi:hypothetical protein